MTGRGGWSGRLRHIQELLTEARAARDFQRSTLAKLADPSGESGTMADELRRAVERWKAWFGRRDAVAAGVLPHVTRWEWSIGRRYSLLPLHFQRYPGRARVLREEPRSRAQHTKSGLDADGRLLTTSVFNYREEASEAFVLYGSGVTDVVEFSPGPHIPLEHTQIELEDDRVVHVETLRLNGYSPQMGTIGQRSPDQLIASLGPNGRFFSVEDYRYDGPLLREITGYGESPGVGPHRYVDRVMHGAGGSLIAIDRIWEGRGATQAVYRRRQKGQSLDELRRAAVAELVHAVVEAVGAAGFVEPVYCLELSYQAVQQYFPPLVTIGFERQRVTLAEPDLAFRPLLSGGRTIELPDADRLEACRQLDQEVRSSGRWAVGTATLREVAAALTRHDWTGVMLVTDDFVAFAIEPESDELDEALAASASPARIADWKARGWL